MSILKPIDAALKQVYLHSPLARPAMAARLHKAWWYARFRRWRRDQAETWVAFKPALYERLADSEQLRDALDFLEFGVYHGESMACWTRLNPHPESRFFGFDSFTGLPEAWGTRAKGHFSRDGQPPRFTDPRVTFVAGLFQETLPRFLLETPLSRRKVIHLDADLYSSTLFVLLHLAPVLRANDLLIFDEFHCVVDEFRAFINFLEAYPLPHRVVARSPDWVQTVIRLEAGRPAF
jgi:hypothetical protein